MEECHLPLSVIFSNLRFLVQVHVGEAFISKFTKERPHDSRVSPWWYSVLLSGVTIRSKYEHWNKMVYITMIGICCCCCWCWCGIHVWLYTIFRDIDWTKNTSSQIGRFKPTSHPSNHICCKLVLLALGKTWKSYESYIILYSPKKEDSEILPHPYLAKLVHKSIIKSPSCCSSSVYSVVMLAYWRSFWANSFSGKNSDPVMYQISAPWYVPVIQYKNVTWS